MTAFKQDNLSPVWITTATSRSLRRSVKSSITVTHGVVEITHASARWCAAMTRAKKIAISKDKGSSYQVKASADGCTTDDVKPEPDIKFEKEDCGLHKVKLVPYNRRLQNKALVQALEKIPLGTTEHIYEYGAWYFKREKYRYAFLYFDICVLKSPKESRFRLARAAAAFHLQVYKLAITDSAYALELKEQEGKSQITQDIHRALSPEVQLKLQKDSLRDKARCAYWQGKAQFARGKYAEARAAFLHSHQIFPNHMARHYLVEMPRGAGDGRSCIGQQTHGPEKNLFLPTAQDDSQLTREVLWHPFESSHAQEGNVMCQTHVFERTGYEQMLCDLVFEHYAS